MAFLPLAARVSGRQRGSVVNTSEEAGEQAPAAAGGVRPGGRGRRPAGRVARAPGGVGALGQHLFRHPGGRGDAAATADGRYPLRRGRAADVPVRAPFRRAGGAGRRPATGVGMVVRGPGRHVAAAQAEMAVSVGERSVRRGWPPCSWPRFRSG